MKSNRILITGGLGFLGQYVIKDILKSNQSTHITILDLKENPNTIYSPYNNPNINVLINKNICKYDSIKSYFKNIDTVIHLAGFVSFSLKDKTHLENINILGTKNILKACLNFNVKNLIHISSVAALGYNDNKHTPINENFKFNWNIAKRRKKHYMLTKYLADIEVHNSRKHLNCSIIYPGLMLGPGDINNSYKLIEAISKKSIPFNMPGGTNIIDVRDVSRGILSLLNSNKTNENYLLSGHNLTFEEINNQIAKIVSTNSPKFTLPKKINTPFFYLLLLLESISKNKLPLTADNIDSAFKFRYFSNKKASNDLEWEPQFSFKKTIEDTYEWIKNEGLN